MTSKSQKIRCLFGFHDYPDSLSIFNNNKCKHCGHVLVWTVRNGKIQKED